MTSEKNHPVLPFSGPALAEALEGAFLVRETPGVRGSRTAEGAAYVSELQVSATRASGREQKR